MQIPTTETKLADLATQVSEIKGIVYQMDKRIDSMDKRIDSVEHTQRELLKGQRWIIGLLFTLLLAIFGATTTILLQ